MITGREKRIQRARDALAIAQADLEELRTDWLLYTARPRPVGPLDEIAVTKLDRIAMACRAVTEARERLTALQ